MSRAITNLQTLIRGLEPSLNAGVFVYSSVPHRADLSAIETVRGEQHALPYAAPRATDPDKQAQLTAAYQSYTRGELPPEQLPDLSDIFPDDAETCAEIGLEYLRTPPGSSNDDVAARGAPRVEMVGGGG